MRQWCDDPRNRIRWRHAGRRLRVDKPLTTTVPGSVESAQVELVRRAASGDNLAFERLVIDRVDRLYRTARAILGNEPDARDATQEAFVAAWRELPRLRGPGELRRVAPADRSECVSNAASRSQPSPADKSR